MNHSIRQNVATMTALAAACTMLLTAPAIAAPETAAANTAAISAPSAVDSSTRVIRRANTNAVVTQTNAPNLSQDSTVNPTNSTDQNNSISQNNAPVVNNTPAMNSAAIAQPAPVTAAPTTADTAPAQSAPATRVYQRGPISPTGIDISKGQLPAIPVPQVRISDISFVPSVFINQTQSMASDKLDVSLLDDFIEDVSPNARHYPPNFPNRSQRHYAREKIKVLAEWIDPYASAPNASYDVLIRAAKLNGMGRNLDLGSDFAVRGGKYVDRAIKLKPDSGEANFLYGMMLSEGGGFKEGQKYLDRAVSLGYTEAEQSLAQSDLLSDRRSAALERLRRLAQQMPDNAVIRQQIKLVEDGEYYIWDIPAPNVNIKPMS